MRSQSLVRTELGLALFSWLTVSPVRLANVSQESPRWTVYSYPPVCCTAASCGAACTEREGIQKDNPRQSRPSSVMAVV